MRIESASFTRAGPRPINEDRYLLPDCENNDAFIVAIADGVGGAAGGEIAASLAIQATKSIGPEVESLDKMFSEAVMAIQKRAAQQPELAGMGTTLSIAIIIDFHVYVGHVGDTRIYHLRGNGLNSLTQDQTEIAELVRKGVFSSRQALRYPRRNILLSALSAKNSYEVYRSQAALEAGDRIVLMSDGAHQNIAKTAILELSKSGIRLKDFLLNLEGFLLTAAPKDNFTAVCVQVI